MLEELLRLRAVQRSSADGGPPGLLRRVEMQHLPELRRRVVASQSVLDRGVQERAHGGVDGVDGARLEWRPGYALAAAVDQERA